jgi:hypothetical protein
MGRDGGCHVLVEAPRWAQPPLATDMKWRGLRRASPRDCLLGGSKRYFTVTDKLAVGTR